jgi:hypothetical protein
MASAIYLTIDTELNSSLHRKGWSADANFDLAIEAKTAAGDFGLSYQLRTLNEYGIKAIFYVDPMPALLYGLPIIQKIVEPILTAGQEVQLHIHTEWLDYLEKSPVDGRLGNNIGDFSLTDQILLIGQAADLMEQAGAPRPVAFRAGNFGANDDTLLALAELGIPIDSSYNAGADCRICTITPPASAIAPGLVGETVEVPVTVFADGRGLRSAQLCALSAAEMRWLIDSGLEKQLSAITIVSHSFELINRQKSTPHYLNIRRFNALCEKMAVSGAAQEIDFQKLRQVSAVPAKLAPSQSHLWRTGWRLAEQLYGRLRYE